MIGTGARVVGDVVCSGGSRGTGVAAVFGGMGLGLFPGWAGGGGAVVGGAVVGGAVVGGAVVG
ncbi:MAG: hypothetical protein M3508_07500, partial [Actinomycetota bacterium]|nr:hypothetical protein [Actinomycetota bacterium]